MSKGTLTALDLQEPITLENSGVYEYDEELFGESPDEYTEGNKYPIYYYRGILGDDMSSADGASSNNYPNYVLIPGTFSACYRILRTTSAGEIKVIYAGRATGTPLNCANVQYDTAAFNGSNSSSSFRRAVYAGYYYNQNYNNTSTSQVSLNDLFGVNNSTASTIAGSIEQSGSSTKPLGCNDRTLYRNGQETPMQPSETIRIYGGDGTEYHFGAYMRNASISQKPSLSCVQESDVITRAALLTADEASFAGSGSSTATNGSASHVNSFLNIGQNFWTMSPHSIATSGNVRMFYINANGALANSHVGNEYAVRVVLIPDKRYWRFPVSGNGTALDPWIINV